MKNRIKNVFSVFAMVLLAALLFCVPASADNPTVPAENSIEAIRTEFSDGRLTVNLRVSATQQLAESEYRYGIKINNRENFQDDESSYLSMISGPTMDEISNEQIFTLEVHQMFVPGATYYLKGMLQQQNYDTDGNPTFFTEILEGTQVISFTGPGSDADFDVLAMNESGTVRQYNDNQFLFTPTSGGMYAISGTTAAVRSIEVYRSNGDRLADSYQNGDDSVPYAVFYANAGEKCYIRAYANNGDGVIRATAAEQVIPHMTLEQALGVDSGATVCFTAVDEGYYIFSCSGPETSWHDFAVMDIRTGKWNRYNDIVSLHLGANETVCVQMNYPQWELGQQLGIAVEKIIPPAENTIEAIETEDANGRLTVSLRVSATSQLAEKGYAYGIKISNRENFQQDQTSYQNMIGGPIMKGIVNERVFTMEVHPMLVPGVKYYLKGALLQPDSYDVNGNPTFLTEVLEGRDIIQATAPGSDADFTELPMNGTGTVEQYNVSKFLFTPATEGRYAISGTSAAVRSIVVCRSNGDRLANAYQNDGNSIPSAVFYANAGEKCYIEAYANNGDGVIRAAAYDGIADSIEVAAATNISNIGAEFTFTYSASAETAQNGYLLGILTSPDGNFETKTDIYPIPQPRYDAADEQEVTGVIEPFVPGKSVWYKAVMINRSNKIICQGDAVYHLTTKDSLEGFTRLVNSEEVNYSTLGRNKFYFEVPAAGIYTIRAVNAANVGVFVNGNAHAKPGYNVDSILLDFYARPGDKVFILAIKNNDSNSSIEVTDTQDVLSFPSDLKTLEEAACAGLNIQAADFSGCTDLETIGSKAFAGCSRLATVVLPKASIDIAADAFENCGSIILIAPEDGSVEAYAKAHGIPFVRYSFS